MVVVEIVSDSRKTAINDGRYCCWWHSDDIDGGDSLSAGRIFEDAWNLESGEGGGDETTGLRTRPRFSKIVFNLITVRLFTGLCFHDLRFEL